MPVGSPLAGLLAAAGGGGADLYVGSFTKTNTTGTQAITGVGFTPKAIVFWTSGSNAASGTWDQHIYQGIGFTSGASDSYSVSGASFDNAGTSSTARRIAAKAITLQLDDANSSNIQEADLSSFDADGFTLNWTTNGGIPALSSTEVMFLAIGGDDVSAKVVNWTSPTSTGNKAVTGVGFEPTVVLHSLSGAETTVPSSAAGMVTSFGAMDGSGNQWTNTVGSRDGLSTTDTARYQRTDKAIATLRYNGVGLPVWEEAEYVSMDSDGFTLNFTSAIAAAYEAFSLCLSGLDAKVGNFAKTTSGAPASQSVTGVGFEPGALLLSNVEFPASTSVVQHAYWSLGAGDGTNERVAEQNDQDAQSTTNADSLWKNDKITHMGDASLTTVAEADLTSLDADGFTLNWTTNNASVYEILYLALG